MHTVVDTESILRHRKKEEKEKKYFHPTATSTPGVAGFFLGGVAKILASTSCIRGDIR